jgi:hypothetical protein
MPKINNGAEFVAEYPDLVDVPLLDALFWAYRIGRLDGTIDLLNRQAIKKEKKQFEEFEMPAERKLSGRA